MGKPTHLRWTLIPLTVALTVVALHKSHPVHADQAPPPAQKTIKLGEAKPGTLYAMTVAVKDPTKLQGSDAVLATIKDSTGVIDSKWLHTADLDFYLTVRPRAAGPVTVTLSSANRRPKSPRPYRRSSAPPCPPSPRASSRPPLTAPGKRPNPSNSGKPSTAATTSAPTPPRAMKTATPPCSKASNGSSSPLRNQNPAWSTSPLTSPTATYRSTWTSSNLAKTTRPLHQGRVRLPDRSHPELSRPVQIPDSHPASPNQTYYIRVAGNHPAYQLHTSDFPVPPYSDPHQAVRAGMDFLVNMGDSWLSNTPRRGAVALRTTMQHSETQLCIACHPAQFTDCAAI